MKKAAKTTAGILAMCACLCAGCSKKTESDTARIGLSVSTQNNPFFVTMVEGAKAAAQNTELIVIDARDDTVKQASDIEDLVSKKVSVLIVNPVDSSAVAPAVALAKRAGIPVVAVDRAVIGESVTCQIASDNVAGAKMAGEYLLKLTGKNAKIAEIEGIPGASATIDRGKGFHQAVDGKANVVARLTANFNRVEGMDVAENLLQSHPDITGIFAHNDEMALGALEAAGAAGKKIAVVGFDATLDALASIKSGNLAATVAQQPAEMGKIAVQTALQIMKGKTVAASIPVAVTLIAE
ncbi:MAG: substrate-binding domain-containing protein [Bacteroides sp.]|nr:substrate-binding domain-containing protein [Prevotella sp.]MCM1406907.1 substrate-binding domain-containing protein [Treponema brennaborense]MCM1470058.1 substrate-binding domain-containing protein [Bacteroides sp.]